jgi:hypothetical protein
MLESVIPIATTVRADLDDYFGFTLSPGVDLPEAYSGLQPQTGGICRSPMGGDGNLDLYCFRIHQQAGGVFRASF